MKPISLKSYLLAGLVVWLPIVVTFVVLRFIVDLLDVTVALLPQAYHPEQLFGVHIPGFGVILSLLLLITTGVIATNILGQRLVGWGESILNKIPLVRSIYSATKQVMQTIFSKNSQAFRKVLLIEYPRKDMWTVAFLTGSPEAQVTKGLEGEMVSVFVPTTPMPTAGFLLMVAKSETIELSLSVDEALKYIISLGVMQPSMMVKSGNLTKQATV